MFDILGSALSGGFLGLVGSIFNKGFLFLEKKEEAKFKQQEWEQEIKLLNLQQTYKLQELDKKQELLSGNLDGQLRESSYKHDSDLGLASLWVINILRLVRPTLTLILIIVMAILWFTIGESQTDLQAKIIEAILFCATSSLTWWFGDRVKKN